MSDFPPGAPQFQLCKPLKGVCYQTEDGRIWVMHEGRNECRWVPPTFGRPIDQDEE